jgi:hypothetical protein
MRSRGGFMIGAAAAVIGSTLAMTAPASATEVYGSPLPPNQNWTGSLGLDFMVNTPVTVDALGAYFGGGVGADVTVEIFTSGGIAVPGLLAVIPTTTSPYTFVPVVPVVLTPGSYQVTAWGYGPIGNYNTGFSGIPISFDTFGGALSEGDPWYNDPGVTGFASDHLDDFNSGFGTFHFYGAGNFDIAQTPLPTSWSLLIAGFIGLSFLTRRAAQNRSARAASV